LFRIISAGIGHVQEVKNIDIFSSNIAIAGSKNRKEFSLLFQETTIAIFFKVFLYCTLSDHGKFRPKNILLNNNNNNNNNNVLILNVRFIPIEFMYYHYGIHK
jgi:hypothetical protein